jgi:hypothetical protein
MPSRMAASQESTSFVDARPHIGQLPERSSRGSLRLVLTAASGGLCASTQHTQGWDCPDGNRAPAHHWTPCLPLMWSAPAGLAPERPHMELRPRQEAP